MRVPMMLVFFAGASLPASQGTLMVYPRAAPRVDG